MAIRKEEMGRPRKRWLNDRERNRCHHPSSSLEAEVDDERGGSLVHDCCTQTSQPTASKLQQLLYQESGRYFFQWHSRITDHGRH